MLNAGTLRLVRALLPEGWSPEAAVPIGNVPFCMEELREARLLREAGDFAAAMAAYKCAFVLADVDESHT